MKKYTLSFFLLLTAGAASQLKAQENPHPILHYQMAQPRVTPGDATPATFIYSADKINAKEAMLVITAKIKTGWHIYSQKVSKGGPVKTTITFQPSKAYSLIGTISESKPMISHDKTFNMEVSYFEKTVVFKQRVKLHDKQVTIKGMLEYMAGKGTENLPPVNTPFTFMVI